MSGALQALRQKIPQLELTPGNLFFLKGGWDLNSNWRFRCEEYHSQGPWRSGPFPTMLERTRNLRRLPCSYGYYCFHIFFNLLLIFYLGGLHVKLPGEMWLAEYVRDTLMMGDCDEVCGPNSAIAKHVQLQHLISLWTLFDEKLNVDPFKDISHKYKKPLTVCGSRRYPFLFPLIKFKGANNTPIDSSYAPPSVSRVVAGSERVRVKLSQ
jgi:hypothetical protein